MFYIYYNYIFISFILTYNLDNSLYSIMYNVLNF